MIGDDRTTLFSKAVEIRGNIEALPLPSAAEDLAKMLSSGAAQGDPELRLQVLAMKGDIDKAPFRSVIDDYYLTNPIARASAVMAECSALAEGRGAMTAAE